MDGNRSNPHGSPNTETNQNVSEKPIIIAEVALSLRASKDNKVWLLNQNHMDRGDDTRREKNISNNKLLAVVKTEHKSHMSRTLSRRTDCDFNTLFTINSHCFECICDKHFQISIHLLFTFDVHPAL